MLPECDESLSFKHIVSPHDWNSYTQMRQEIENVFQGMDVLVESMVDRMRLLVERKKAKFFLLFHGETAIGGIGFVPLRSSSQVLYARLQEVDIHPSWQGQGFGNQLLSCLVRELNFVKIHRACLLAEVGDWPHQWYSKVGFARVGVLEI